MWTFSDCSDFVQKSPNILKKMLFFCRYAFYSHKPTTFWRICATINTYTKQRVISKKSRANCITCMFESLDKHILVCCRHRYRSLLPTACQQFELKKWTKWQLKLNNKFQEWGTSLTHTFVGGYRLELDQTWTPIDRINDVDDKRQTTKRLLQSANIMKTLRSIGNNDGELMDIIWNW